MKHAPILFSSFIALIAGCGDDDDPGGPTTIAQPVTYSFESRFEPGVSSVAYSGQVKRHLLIESLKSYIGQIDDQTFASANPGEVIGALTFFYDFKNEGADDDTPLTFSTGTVSPAQATWGALGGNLVSLKEKFPEFDANFVGSVVGYETDETPPGGLSPEATLLDMFARLEDLVLKRVNGAIPPDPSGADIRSVYVTREGIDFQQLIQKYLGGAVALSQGSDDYLDDDIEGKGLLSDNDGPVISNGVEAPYTALEHVWDEGFGYFGAARNYADFTDDEIAGAGGRPDWQGAHDLDQDGRIDLLGEYNFGHSVNAAKRDRGSVVATDFTKDAFDAFLAGRTLIVNAGADLDEDQLAMLRGYRDTLVGAWEKAIAATAVHYINDVLQDMAAFDTAEYDSAAFLAHAKHWSELKGFALALQFNVNHSPLTAGQLVELHGYIGNQPVLPSATAEERAAYADALRAARSLLGQVYEFASANLGDDAGLNGW